MRPYPNTDITPAVQIEHSFVLHKDILIPGESFEESFLPLLQIAAGAGLIHVFVSYPVSEDPQ
jgi:hypothetical protein